MVSRFILVFFVLSFHLFLHAEKIHYPLTNDPIDVVILAHPKDTETLGYCIKGIRENCMNLRRVIVVSSIRLSDECEWFNEKNFPFSLNDVVLAIGREDENKAKKYFHHHWRPPGWYLQQLLKLYAPFVIPDISSNVLVLDADTIFMNPVNFLNGSNGGLFCVSHLRPKQRYLKFAERLIPDYKKTKGYSICHHMLFQKPILEHLFYTVEKHHKNVFWKAFCYAVDLGRNKGASEYEVYFNFALNHSDQVEIRELKWKNSHDLKKADSYKKAGYHFVSFHDYMRE
jgi:Family of unknown function (DUF6492)